VAYSAVDDLLLGNIPLPPGDKAKRAVDRAADEIDAALGTRYVVPIRPLGQQQRQVLALMLTINNWLASGRLIEELTASSQTVELHAYARQLINEALKALSSILSGEIILPGVPPVGGTDDNISVQTGPFVVNVDPSSQTNWYYEQIDNPLYCVQNPSLKLNLAPYYSWPYVGGG
jgi:phage gp36-like protein